jgi:hypothetical protein
MIETVWNIFACAERLIDYPVFKGLTAKLLWKYLGPKWLKWAVCNTAYLLEQNFDGENLAQIMK